MDAKVAAWINALTAQPDYASWKQAKRSVYPLGPGTHSWLVLLTADGKELGYLIVASDKDGEAYSLVEYGAGGNPLYSLNTLYQALIRHEIIDPHLSYDAFVKNDQILLTRVYLGPLQSFWQVTIRTDSLYFDAKTGELLPNMGEQAASGKAASSVADGAPKKVKALTKTVAVEPFDPFEKTSWLKPETPSLTLKRDIAIMLEHRERLTYSAKLFGGKLTYAFALAGYDEWNEDTAYVRLDQDGTRAVPLDSLLTLGRITY